MRIILLSGGSGKRLWPLSNDVRSKQFLKILDDGNRNRCSMLQRVYSKIKEVCADSPITIATNGTQVESIRLQLGDAVDIVSEPQRRDTFPAIALAAAYLVYEKHAEENEVITILPVDAYAESGYYSLLNDIANAVKSNVADIALMGIKPVVPTSKYGYIVPDSEEKPGRYSVRQFVEKPDEKAAQELINNGAFWNGGVFAVKIGYVLDILRKQVDFESYEELISKYGDINKNSFDYEVVEKADKIVVLPYEGEWSDIGSWRTMTEKLADNYSGNVVVDNCDGTYIINELNIPVCAIGIKDAVITATPDGILVSDLVETSRLKEVAGRINVSRNMHEKRRWGEYTIVDQDDSSLIKRLFLAEGKGISYQLHKYRDEVWIVTFGLGELTIDGKKSVIRAGESITILRGQKHRVVALTDLWITEVQLGNPLVEEDIVKFVEV